MTTVRSLGSIALIAVIAAALTGLRATPAEACRRDFAWSYGWFTPAEGEKEFELWLTHNQDSAETLYQLEYEFALTERWAVGAYLQFEDAPGSDLDWHGWKWENRYRFGEFKADRWLHAAYLELAKAEGEPYEVEGKWLLSRYGSGGSATVFNLIAEKELAADHEIEWGYSAGWNHAVKGGWRLGAESKGNFTEHEYYAGPSVVYDASSAWRFVAGALVGLNDRSDDLQVRFITEYEWS